jgi:hypothetical protein
MKATRNYRANDGKIIEILADHVRTGGGNFNGVCVSACLSYLDIKPNDYKFTWSKRTGNSAVHSIMRRFGWCVRSRKTAFKKATTVSALKKAIKGYTDLSENVCYYVHVNGHALLISANGDVLVDTDPRQRDRRKVLCVKAIFRE